MVEDDDVLFRRELSRLTLLLVMMMMNCLGERVEQADPAAADDDDELFRREVSRLTLLLMMMMYCLGER